MKQEINPKETNRAIAFELWMKSPMPMVIGTSAMTATELDSIVSQYNDQFCDPMVMWGKYRKHWFKVNLPISFQFHHVQMDGGHAARFLEELQKTINTI